MPRMPSEANSIPLSGTLSRVSNGGYFALRAESASLIILVGGEGKQKNGCIILLRALPWWYAFHICRTYAFGTFLRQTLRYSTLYVTYSLLRSSCFP